MNINQWAETLKETGPASDTPHNSIFIVGAPRSGTTFLYQLLSFQYDIGYIDNLIARFHWDPVLGVCLRREIGYKKEFTGKSIFGRTTGISEPHEFGRYWRDQLGYDDMRQKPNHNQIELDKLAASLNQISMFFGKPVLYKPFHLVFHLHEMVEKMQNSKWIFVERDELQNALSLISLREARGDIHTPQSLYPTSANLYQDPYENIIAQIRHINNLITVGLSSLPDSRYLKITLDALTENTSSTLKSIEDQFSLSQDKATSKANQESGERATPENTASLNKHKEKLRKAQRNVPK